MGRRPLTVFSLLLMPIVGVTAALWLVSYDLDPRYDYIGISRIRISASSGSASISNQAVPYSGSITAIAWGIRQPPLPKVRGIDFPGVYFRCLTWPGRTDWTLTVSLLYPLILTAIWPLMWAFAPWLRSRNVLQCRHCDYNLTGNTSGVCPECGTPTSAGVKA